MCNSGKCVQNTISPGVTSAAHWSEWSTSECKSGCIVRSKGFKEKTRTCIKQTPVTIGSTCPGQSRDSVVGCSPGCEQGETKTAQSYAKTMCTKFLEIEPALKRKINAYGEQTKHSMDRPELACQVKHTFENYCTDRAYFQVHCQKKGSSQLYAPVTELQERTDVSVSLKISHHRKLENLTFLSFCSDHDLFLCKGVFPRGDILPPGGVSGILL